MDYQTIKFDMEGPVATITLDRPERLNAINQQVVMDVTDALENARIADHVRCIVLRGDGRAFCSGDDLKSGGESRRYVGTSDFQSTLKYGYPHIVQDILNIRKPVIARLHGYAVGAGFDIALSCDFKIAAEGTQFGALFVKRGLGGGCCYLLTKHVGLTRATEMLFLGDFVDAQKAAGWGIINKVVPMDQLDEEVDKLAQTLAEGPTGSYALIKTGRNRGLTADIASGLEYQAIANLEIPLMEDSIEGPMAFREKRPAKFTGRRINVRELAMEERQRSGSN